MRNKMQLALRLPEPGDEGLAADEQEGLEEEPGDVQERPLR